MVPPLMPIGRRDITSTVDAAKNSFNSWDKCMAKTVCKWPVIVVVVVAGLIALSLLFCLFRCLCCGAQCCCGCLSCCNACCPSPRKGHRRVESPPPDAFPVKEPYKAHLPMYNGPQTATFDVSKGRKVDDDALPAMPSWETAKETKVEVEEAPPPVPSSALEMDRLDQNGRSPGSGSNDNSPMLSNQPFTPGVNDWYNNGQQDAGVFHAGQHAPYGDQNNSNFAQPQGGQRGAAPRAFQQEQQPYHFADAPYPDANRAYPAVPPPQFSAPSPVYAHQQPDRHQRAPSATYQRQMNHPPIQRNHSASPYHQPASPYQAFNNPGQNPASMSAPLRAGQQGGGLGGFREV